MSDTIYALATAPGRSAVAVVRLSGPGSKQVLERLGAARLKPRVASLRTLRDATGERLDRGLALWFPGPGSYTGEDCGELHIHGGVAVVQSVMAAIAALGPRLAEAGEFTRRAFENGKLDLEQAEAVADLIDAETSAQARQAIGQLAGALGDRHRTWRERLTELLAQLEACVDFPDEDLPPEIVTRASGLLEGLIAELDVAAEDGVRGRQVREGYRIAIIGEPNAGKSTLLNALTGREIVIVSPIAGTTRDVVEASDVLAGYRVVLADMAGLREAFDPVEIEGVRRASVWAEAADLRVWVIDQASDGEGWRPAAALARAGDLAVINKTDLPSGLGGKAARTAAADLGLEVLSGSVIGKGAAVVRQVLTAKVSEALGGGDFPATTRARHQAHLAAARGHLLRAFGALVQPELAAEDVRLASRELTAVTGGFGAEAVLDQIFANFCIGK
jgi:tRNA modification GTPase